MGEYGRESHQAMISFNYSMTFPSAATSPGSFRESSPKEAGVILGGMQDGVVGVIAKRVICSGSTLTSCMA